MIGAPTVSADAFSAAFDRSAPKPTRRSATTLVARWFDLNQDAEALAVALDRAALAELRRS